ncbi:ferritin-like domain-containing protein [Rhabdochromatium marinum]|uniref:ferritin-like domain-containing protein n=1 Tax=Rhabdochromatium marinum TaxID=48729 RepID=UPI001904437B|nr:ferritin family protein [Rhabdochromatium marinum]MBK1648900.1 rubrerythrin [Rhabdochromatium marinum]
MNNTSERPIESLEELCAHALELEQESVGRFQQLADSMEVHHNQEVAGLFLEMARLSSAHMAAIEAQAQTQGLTLPKIPPWEFKWNCPDRPESHCLDEDVSYLMTATQALRLALFNEQQAQAFYQSVVEHSPNARVRELAAEMAAEEAEHVHLLQEWLNRQPADEEPAEDFDPPNMPE